MKLKNFTKSIAVFAMVLIATLCMGAGSTKVKAADVGYISSVQQTGADKHAVTVTWTPVSDATSYNVYYADYSKGYDAEYVLAGSTADTSYTITGLDDGSKYDVKVAPVNATGEGYGKSCYDDVITLPDSLSYLKQTKWWYFIHQLDVEWEKQNAVDGYEVVLYDNNGKKVSKQILTGSYSYYTTFKNMKHKVYTVQARSYKVWNGTKYYSSWSKIYCLNQARITSAKVSGNKLNIKWGKVAGATSYEVYVSTKPKSGYKKVATVSKNKSSYTVKKVKGKKISSKKTYYVYVKTVCKKGKTKNTSGALYYWNTKSNGFGYL